MCILDGLRPRVLVYCYIVVFLEDASKKDDVDGEVNFRLKTRVR